MPWRHGGIVSVATADDHLREGKRRSRRTSLKILQRCKITARRGGILTGTIRGAEMTSAAMAAADMAGMAGKVTDL